MTTNYMLPITGITFLPYLVGGLVLIVGGIGAYVASKFRD